MALDKAVALLDSATAATGVRMAVEQTLNDRHVFFVGSLLDHKAISLVSRAGARGRAEVAPCPGRAALLCSRATGVVAGPALATAAAQPAQPPGVNPRCP